MADYGCILENKIMAQRKKLTFPQMNIRALSEVAPYFCAVLYPSLIYLSIKIICV